MYYSQASSLTVIHSHVRACIRMDVTTRPKQVTNGGVIIRDCPNALDDVAWEGSGDGVNHQPSSNAGSLHMRDMQSVMSTGMRTMMHPTCCAGEMQSIKCTGDSQSLSSTGDHTTFVQD